MFSENVIGDEVRKYCADIGKDPLLVQGAGGNVSWKTGGTLWIKASGTWLENAVRDQIFIPVDLSRLRSDINAQKWDATPSVMDDCQLRPSIETTLHALMPHTVVVHIHAIEVLAHLVRGESYDYFHSRLGEVCSFALVDYHKPGAQLAAAVYEALMSQPSVKLVLLKNHGIVVGGETVSAVRNLITEINTIFSTKPIIEIDEKPVNFDTDQAFQGQYTPVDDVAVQQLAFQPELFKRLCSDWALYPDHVVFLGAEACAHDSWAAFELATKTSSLNPDLVFISECGVFTSQALTRTKLAQLRSYLDVIVRQSPNSPLATLENFQIAELLNWDAERYRTSLDV
ncbi:class II aldolase/adducin family protein [Luminiphilus sp.]|nr:class II aldolase/adducin family protein [Luminiphilus sp.]